MKALIEIKLAKHVDFSNEKPDWKKYEHAIDEILEDDGYYLMNVSAYSKKNTEPFVEYRVSMVDNLPLIRVAADLNETQVAEFKVQENSIIEKALEVLGDKYLEAIDITEPDCN